MRSTCFLLVLLIPALASSAPVPKGSTKHPWVGKLAFPKTASVKLYTLNNGTETAALAANTSAFYTIAKVADDRVVVGGVLIGRNAPGGSTPTSYYKKDDVLTGDEAIEYYTDALKTKPKDRFLLASRGWAYFTEGKRKEAEADYTTLVELEPGETFHRARRVMIRMAVKKFDAALEDLDHLLAESPNYEWARRQRASALAGLKKFDEAIAVYTKLLETSSDKDSVRIGRGLVYDHSGQHEKALEDYEAVIAANPKSAVAWNNKAWLRATCPEAKMRNGKEAVELATKACELTEWANAGYLDTLAAAYAEAGDFEKAVKWQKEAVRDKELQHDEGTEIKDRLELYTQKKPYRQKVEKK